MMTRALLFGICGVLTVVTTASAQTSAGAPRSVVERSMTLSGGAEAERAPIPVRAVAPTVLPGTRETAFSTIQGYALNSINGILPDSLVRLRDARLGRIVNTQLTDKSGQFQFRAVDPGSYIVELMGNAEAVLAASQLLSVNAGETISAEVKLPFQRPALGGLLGHTTSQAAIITAAAAATGVISAAATTDVSPDGTK